MNPLEQAVRLNNEAARLLLSGSLLEAARLLQQGIDNLKQSEYSSATTLTDHTTHPATADIDHSNGCRQPGDAIYFYDHPIFLPTEIKVLTLDDHTRTVYTVSIYTIFNLALVYHLYGEVTGMDGPSERSMDLYQIILSGRIEETTEPIDAISYALLRCLVWNNLSHLHYKLDEYDEGKYCLDCCREIIDITNCLDEAGPLSKEEMSAIKLNLVMKHYPVVARAA